MNYLLIAVGILFLVMAVVGLHRGFIRSIWPFAAMILTVVLLWILAPVFRDALMENTQMDERIELKIHTSISEKTKPDSPLSEQLRDWPLPKSMKEALSETVDEAVDQSLNAGDSAISRYLMGTTMTAISYIGGFIVIYLVLLLIGKLLKLASKLPVLSQADKILGLLVGILWAFLIVEVFFLIMTGFSHTPFGTQIMKMIADSDILSALYELNFLTGIFT